MTESIMTHYERIADSYNQTWTHRPTYLSWMGEHISTRLRTGPGDRVVDIGAGTGLFLRYLAENATPETPILCIDPAAQMLEQLPADLRLRPVQATAEDIATARVDLPYDELDAILIKEAVHHITDLTTTLSGLAGRLAPGGRLLVVTAPPELDYPLFESARKRFAEAHPQPEVIAAAMHAAGLATQCKFEEFVVTVDRDHYLELIGNRWMSVLSTFSDDELAAGLDEMRLCYPGDELVFVDRFAFVLGTRLCAPGADGGDTGMRTG